MRDRNDRGARVYEMRQPHMCSGKYDPDISRRTCRACAWCILHRFVMSQIVVDMVAFDVHVKPVSFVYSVVLTLVFTWFVDRLMRKKIDAISMTESLKSVD